MLTVALILKASLLVPDAAGHLNRVKMPEDEAKAIVTRCTSTSAPSHCAGTLIGLSFRESGNNFAAVHDGGRGCGAFGLLCTFPHSTWQEQVDSAWSQVLKSTLVCVEPLQMYCSGSCTRGRKIAQEYMGIARKIAAEIDAMTAVGP